jgi:3-hydroxybutyryl-CoA dehydrogenase
MPIDEIKKVCFVGAGTMGSTHSLVAGMAGYEAVVYDLSQEALERVPLRQEIIAVRLVEERGFDQDGIKAGMKRVRIVSDPAEAVENADLLSESVPERVELKRTVHKQFDELCPEHTIMTTNTSSLPVSDIEDAVRRGDKFAAMHFHGPFTLVDIMKGPRTSSRTVDILKKFVRSTGQVPLVLKKEKPGYLHNTMFIGLLKTGALLVADGFADKEDVDRSWMIMHQSRSGPFGMMDGVGLDVVLDVLEEDYKRTGDPESKKIVDFLRPHVDRGELGMKVGKGFYTYPDAPWMKPEFLTDEGSTS